jgi:hypothetical protein
MKKLTFLAFAFIPMLAFADICSNISVSYEGLIEQLERNARDAILLTDNSGEQNAIIESFQNQAAQLQAERDAALASAGCYPIPPIEPPVTDPTDPPVTDPTDPPINPNDPPATDPTEPPGENPIDPSQSSCHDELSLLAQQMKDLGKSGKEIMEAVKKQAHESRCNFGLFNAGGRVPSHLIGKHRSRPLGGGGGRP